MTIEQGIELIEAHGPGWTPMPKREYLGNGRGDAWQGGDVLIGVCKQGSVYVPHPYSQYVETALEFAIGIAEISAEAWRLTFEDAANTRGSS